MKVVWWRVVGIVSLVVLLAIGFWFVFYSAVPANLSLIISLRNWYQDSLLQAKSNPIYTISVDQGDTPGTYLYSLWGELSRVDEKNQTIYLKAKDGREYALFLGNYGLTFTGEPGDNFIEEGINIFLGAPVLAKWQDTKSLYTLKRDYKKNYKKSKLYPINQNAVNQSLILKIFN